MRSVKLAFSCIAALAAAGVLSTRNLTATVDDEHADHGGGAATNARSHQVQQAGGIPPSGTTAAERLAASPRKGEWVTIKVGAGDSLVAWVVRPQRTPAPVVIVIHENTGLTTWARGVADQLAADGFIAIAPDLITMRRKLNLTAEWSADSGRAAIASLTNDEVQNDLDVVARYGMALQGALPKYGVVGFCWGGARSFLHAVHAPGLSAAVVYYGATPPVDQLGAIRAPVLALYGGSDARITSAVPATDSAMKRLGKPYEFQVYLNAGHGFLRGQEGQDGANLKASQAAWPRTVSFLKANLRA
jgi:carboxymethylenebutenolidase